MAGLVRNYDALMSKIEGGCALQSACYWLSRKAVELKFCFTVQAASWITVEVYLIVCCWKRYFLEGKGFIQLDQKHPNQSRSQLYLYYLLLSLQLIFEAFWIIFWLVSEVEVQLQTLVIPLNSTQPSIIPPIDLTHANPLHTIPPPSNSLLSLLPRLMEPLPHQITLTHTSF